MSRFSSYSLRRVIRQNVACHRSRLAFIVQIMVIFTLVMVIITHAMVIMIQGAIIILNYMAYHHTFGGLSVFLGYLVIEQAQLSLYKSLIHPGFRHICNGFLRLGNEYHNNFYGISMLSYGLSSYMHWFP